jgi:hypothetical protein
VDLENSVGVATGYGMDGPGMDPGGGARFSTASQTGRGAHSAPYTMGTGSFPGLKRPVRGVDHPPPSGAEVIEEYNYSSTPFLGLRCLFKGPLYLYAVFL